MPPGGLKVISMVRDRLVDWAFIQVASASSGMSAICGSATAVRVRCRVVSIRRSWACSKAIQSSGSWENR